MLARVLAKTETIKDPNVLVGFDTADDAGVYLINPDLAIVETIDFFTPIVDDPFLYGQIAAANALSDIYAMGAEPLFALSVIGFPQDSVSEEDLAAIVQGGTAKMNEAKTPVIGGHSVQDREIKFGYAVTGKVHPSQLLSNAGAKPGDVLLLSKPLGTGILATGIKFGKTPPAIAEKAIQTMLQLNGAVSRFFPGYTINAVTDVTGFGLVGHGLEIARASQVTLVIDASRVPVLDGVSLVAEKCPLPGGIRSNLTYAGQDLAWEGVPKNIRDVLLDPQTSGGLLISLPEESARSLQTVVLAEGIELRQIGRVEKKGPALMRVE